MGLFAAACSDDDGDEAADEDGDEEAAATGGGDGAAGGLLGEVQSRGTLQCGVNETVPGFGLVDEQGEFAGFDVEYCRAVAAAVLGDAESVEFTALDAETRFTALQAGDIDVLIRNTTWTSSRDGTEGSRFLVTTFYDGQGMMVNADSDFQSITDMDGTTICVLSGTTTELNLATAAAGAGVDITPLTFPDNEQLQPAFEAGQCQGWTSDKSQLAGVRSAWPEGQGGPDALVILDDTFSKEPLGPVVLDGDDEWADAVNWAVIATIQAEEFGITSDNVEEMTTSENLDILRFLGQPIPDEEDPEAEAAPFDPGLGLDPEFAVDVISQVGNYAEIYDRNVGPDTPLGLERGFNAQWEDGGLLYAPPYR
ncbi:MAG TPA: amino acid ABC transporter substrate-binding protein [Acidimicrobiales bacterium]|nr:amino acid ABC transporter substrate-binding protein [Acidimicrobiales bacterium]